MKLSQAAQIVNGKLCGQDTEYHTVSIDGRDIAQGDLYIALIGANYDGHDFIEQAANSGAVAAIVSHEVSASIPTILVADTKTALAELASAHRQQFAAKVISVTGSCGKTTTRALMHSVFAQAGKAQASIKSYNNDIGVPLTLLSIDNDANYAVVEMGANHAGEIANLTHIAQPDVAIITNAGAAHLEGFGDLDGVACAKGEIYQGLSSDGIAIVNADDNYAGFWRNLIGSRKIISFALKNTADITAKDVEFDEQGCASFELHTPNGAMNVTLQLIGAHNVMNALAAAAAGYALGLSNNQIQAGLQLANAEQRRLNEKVGIEGVVVIDDSYNANPSSVTAAMQVLARRDGTKILVLGDMLELGPHSQQMHADLGDTAKQLGLDYLYCYGKDTKYTAQQFGKHGRYFESQDELLNELKPYLAAGVTLLVKGSSGMNMNRIVEVLTQTEQV